MNKFLSWKMACMTFAFCAATAIPSPAQTFTSIVSFDTATGLSMGLTPFVKTLPARGKVGKVLKSVLVRHPGSQIFQYVVDRHPEPANARLAAPLARFDGNEVCVVHI